MAGTFTGQIGGCNQNSEAFFLCTYRYSTHKGACCHVKVQPAGQGRAVFQRRGITQDIACIRIAEALSRHSEAECAIFLHLHIWQRLGHLRGIVSSALCTLHRDAEALQC